MFINETGELIITYSDDTTANLGQFLKLHLVQFVDKDGSVISVQLIKDGESAIAPTPPEFTGYVFIEWDQDYDDITSNLLVHAIYQPLSINLIFDSQGGVFCEDLSINYGDMLNLPIPQRTGYNFLGWFSGLDANSYQITNNTNLTSDMTLYARWQKTSSITVTNEAELNLALSDYTITEINFANDIITFQSVNIERGVTINGNGYKIGAWQENPIFYIKEMIPLIPSINIYPSHCEVNINNLEFINLRDNDYRPITQAIYVSNVHNLKLILNNIKIVGNFNFGLYIVSGLNLNINVHNAEISVNHTAINLVGPNYDVYITDSILTAPRCIRLDFFDNAYTYIFNTTFNVLPSTSTEPTAILTTSNGTNNFNIVDSYFNLMLEPNKYQSVIVNSSELNNQTFQFYNCFFDVGHPVLTYLFRSENLRTNYLYYESTIKIKEGVEHIPDNAFFSSNYLQRIILPSTLKTIGIGAFSNNYSLTSIIVPEGVTSIGDYAFAYMTNLSHVYLPASMTYVGTNFSVYGNQAKKIYLNKNCDDTNWHVEWNSEFSEVLNNIEAGLYLNNIGYILKEDNSAIIFDYIDNETELIIPDIVSYLSEEYLIKTIGAYAFLNNKTLTSVTAGNNLEVIGAYAFYSAYKLEEFNTNIDSNIYLIENYAFSKCRSLTSFILPRLITEIKKGTFYNSVRLIEVDLSLAENLVLIGENAFHDCTALRTITIPDSVHTIARYAFYNAYSLSEVIISPNSSLEIIEQSAFSTTALKSIYLPATLTLIDNSAFSYNYMLEEVIFAEGSALESIGTHAFSSNNSLKAIILPQNLTALSIGAFYGCRSLESIYIPQGITVIDSETFYNCSSLSNITFENIDTLTSINTGAFRGAASLATFFIPISVTYVGPNAFLDIPFLVIYCEAESKPETWDVNWNLGGNAVVWGYPG